MDVSLHSDQVTGEDVHFVRLETLLDALSFAGGLDVLEVLVGVDTRHVAAVQDVVHVLQHLLVDDLGVAEEEGHRLVLDTWLIIIIVIRIKINK